MGTKSQEHGSMFNEFYFDKTVDAPSLAAFQASAEQLDVISVPLSNGSATESKADLGNNPYWTTYFSVVQVEESWKEVGCNRRSTRLSSRHYEK